ncbi:MFS transporter [Pedobacter sp. GSP4]|uniref:MFS transporter n=1 Tax=Pedobacter sp. GSP4 TaxID=3453716 RepID=UPI003EF047DD
MVTLIASLGGVLFGFDMAVVSGVLPLLHKQYSFNSAMEGWIVSCALIGCISGVLFSGILSDRLGRKKMLTISAALFLVSAIGCSIAIDLKMLIIFRIIGGMGVGIASNIVPLYISEIAPINKRGKLVSAYQLAITMGILLAYCCNAALLKLVPLNTSNGTSGWLGLIFSKEVWRGMFFIGSIPAALYLLGSLIIPESLRWTANTGGDKYNTTSNMSKSLFWAKEMRKPLLLGVLLPLFSQLSGINAIIYYGPSILSSAGIDLNNALHAQIFFGLANVLFTFIAIWKVDSLGRRPLYLIGSAGAALSLFIIAILFSTGHQTGLFLGIMVIFFLLCFACSMGPLKFVIVSEIFPDAIRGKAVAISIMVMWVSDALIGQLTPILLAKGTALTFGIFAFCCLCAFYVVYKIYPETKGKTFDQIQSLWKK